MNKMVRVLSIDGGGIRGIIPAKILMRVEELLREYSQDANAKISDYFDLIAGTSTGGIIAALCLCPDEGRSGKSKYTAQEMVELYIQYGKEIFKRSKKTQIYDYFGLFNPIYQSKEFERILSSYFGEYRLADLTKPCLIPSYDLEHGKAVFFNKLDGVKNIEENLLLKDVVRATTAAPTYFPVAKLKGGKKGGASYIDGGVFANNPALCAFVEATKFPCAPFQREIMILSLGTGAKDKNYPYHLAKGWGRLGWIVPIIDIYGSAASQTVNHQLQRLYEQKDLEENYLRIEPSLNEFGVDKSLDNVSNKNIQELREVGEAMVDKYDEKLKKFVKKIYDSQRDCPHEHLYKKQR